MDEELLEAENAKLRKRIEDCIEEIDFAVKFARSSGAITINILNEIKKRLVK